MYKYTILNYMLHFGNDYLEGAHEKVIEAIVKTNNEPLLGYGNDKYCKSASEKIKKMCNLDKNEDAGVYFISGGTQTNLIVIDTLLEPYEGVISAETGHISVHEAGAIERTGHKVLTLPEKHGKIKVEDLRNYLKHFHEDANKEHMVFPGMVYITHPTEYGALYTKREVEEISEICKNYEIPLFLDGARLGYALAVENTDLDLPAIAEYCDAFYIGGTKVGTLLGEAIVFTKKNPKRFNTIVKQHGGLLAKGRLMGVQFDTLFTNNLYIEIGKHGIEMSELLKKGLKEKGYKFYYESPTNQQFIIIENKKMEELSKNIGFSFWERYDDNHTVIRFVTSWSTKKSDVEKLIELL